MINSNTDYKVLCIIPARGGSKGLARKNVRSFNGKPLIAWTIEAAKNSKYVCRIIVSTEDDEIAEISNNYGAEVVKRPTDLAQDSSTTVDVVVHVLSYLERENYIPDCILLLQCTSPLRNTEHIDEALDSFLRSNSNCNALISVSKLEHPPWWDKTIDIDGRLKDFIGYDKSLYVRRQDFPDVYSINGAIYIIDTEAFYRNKSFYTEQTMPYVMEQHVSLDIDTELDFILAECIMKYNGKS